MSIFCTLKQRGYDPIRSIVDALANYLTTGQLPPLPEPKITSLQMGEVLPIHKQLREIVRLAL